MTGFEIWLIALSLAMDCFAVSIAGGIVLKRRLWRPMLTLAITCGVFQSLMPLIGWACANTFSHLIESIDHWIAFTILAFLGGRMVIGSFKEKEEDCTYDPTRLKVVLMLAVATSIDAMAVGISFAFLGMNSWTSVMSPIGIIGFVAFAMSLTGLFIGICCGQKAAKKLKAELWGGLVLILIGSKILVEHLITHYE